MTRNLMISLFVVSAVFTTGSAQGVGDPCNENNHRQFNMDRFGSRNEKCNVGPDLALCDYYLKDDWYVENNSVLLNYCPETGSCGVAYPAWMNGTFPKNGDDIVHRNVCIKQNDNCCAEKVEMKLKNCGSFLVYYFVQLLECSQAYCFKSNYSCDEPKPTTTAVPYINQTVTDKAKVSDNNIYIYIGVGVGVGVAVGGAAIAAAVLFKTDRFRRFRQVSSGSKAETNFHDSPPSYEHAINTGMTKK